MWLKVCICTNLLFKLAYNQGQTSFRYILFVYDGYLAMADPKKESTELPKGERSHSSVFFFYIFYHSLLPIWDISWSCVWQLKTNVCLFDKHTKYKILNKNYTLKLMVYIVK